MAIKIETSRKTFNFSGKSLKTETGIKLPESLYQQLDEKIGTTVLPKHTSLNEDHFMRCSSGGATVNEIAYSVELVQIPGSGLFGRSKVEENKTTISTMCPTCGLRFNYVDGEWVHIG